MVHEIFSIEILWIRHVLIAANDLTSPRHTYNYAYNNVIVEVFCIFISHSDYLHGLRNIGTSTNGATCTASAEHRPCDNALDGVSSTRWISGAGTTDRWIIIRLGFAYAVQSMGVIPSVRVQEQCHKYHFDMAGSYHKEVSS